MKKILNYIGNDNWSNPMYHDNSGIEYVDISQPEDPRYPKDLHTVTPDWKEPDRPVHFDEVEVKGWSDDQQLQRKFQHEYSMLSMLQMKTGNYLSQLKTYGKKDADEILMRSWNRTPESLVRDMRKYYDVLPIKPSWFDESEITDLERKIAC